MKYDPDVFLTSAQDFICYLYQTMNVQQNTASLWCHLVAESGTVYMTPPKHGSITLPVHQIRMRHHPSLEHPPELDVTLRWRQQLVVLVTPRDVHFNLCDKCIKSAALNELRRVARWAKCLRKRSLLRDRLKYSAVDSHILTRLKGVDRHFTNKVNNSTGWWIIQLFNNLNQCEDY